MLVQVYDKLPAKLHMVILLNAKEQGWFLKPSLLFKYFNNINII